jgi:stage III sporulation protein SpoIIIAA
MVAARKKLGKTTLIAEMASALSQGGAFLGANVPKVAVLWYSLDEPLGLTLQRFDALNAARGLLVTREPPASAAEFGAALERRRPDVVVIDSLGDRWRPAGAASAHPDRVGRRAGTEFERVPRPSRGAEADRGRRSA